MKHHLYWIEFPDYDSEIKAYREVAHAGIGIGLNAAGVYSAYYCSPTQKLTEERAKEQFFPPWNLYVIVAGIVSEGRLPMRKRCYGKLPGSSEDGFFPGSISQRYLRHLNPGISIVSGTFVDTG